MTLHAGLVAKRRNERWHGVLITGPSGGGKSDLALQMVEAGFSLVSDDRTLIWTSGGKLFGRAPESLAGKIEARGMGILELNALPFSPIDLVVELVGDGEIDRLPASQAKSLLGLEIPLVRVRAFEASSPAKLRRWLIALG